jgi:hypothetical protein
MRAKATTHVLLGCRASRLPCKETCSGRNDLGGEQTWRPEHHEIAAASKADPWKIVFAELRGKPTQSNEGEGR